jgi:hypothetical protein
VNNKGTNEKLIEDQEADVGEALLNGDYPTGLLDGGEDYPSDFEYVVR